MKKFLFLLGLFTMFSNKVESLPSCRELTKISGVTAAGLGVITSLFYSYLSMKNIEIKSDKTNSTCSNEHPFMQAFRDVVSFLYITYVLLYIKNSNVSLFSSIHRMLALSFASFNSLFWLNSESKITQELILKNIMSLAYTYLAFILVIKIKKIKSVI